jgi:ABC-2 type transport system ATP-binding protein
MIEVEHLTKRYGDVLAVDDISFAVAPGRITGFLGPNGAGKSTTMRMIVGLDAPSSGTALVAGHTYRDLRTPLRTIGALLDAAAVEGGRKAADHLLWLAHSNAIDPARVGMVLDQVGLGEFAERRIAAFSLGMRQRLGIAAALLGDPRVVMLDEPINGLDPDGIIWLRGFMRHLADEGRTVFVSSHLMNEVAQTADHVIVIGRGRIVADAPIESVLAQHGLRTVIVRAERQADLAVHLSRHGATIEPAEHGALSVRGLDAAAIGAIAAGEQIALSELTPHQPSLEQAFFELTHDLSLPTVALSASAQGD